MVLQSTSSDAHDTEITSANTSHINIVKDTNPGSSLSKSGSETNRLKDTSPDEILAKHFFPISNLPPVEAAFSILKIRQRIYSYSSLRDLLQFRLVSLDWRRNVTSDTLLKYDHNPIIIISQPQPHARSLKWNAQIIKPLHELQELMDGTGSYPFPCSRFTISYSNRKKQEKVDRFLLSQGSRIQYSNLRLHYPEYCSEVGDIDDTHRMCSHSDNWLKQVVSKLLLKQAPNILELQISFSAAWKFGGKTCTPIQSKNRVEADSINFHSKLESVWVGARRSLFQFFCVIVPNLKSMKDCNLNHYLEPINRLDLLKELSYAPKSIIDRQQKDIRVKRIANMEGKLQLNDLTIFTENINRHSKCKHSEAEICNQILEKCCESLKRLCLTSLGFLPGLTIPKMPNVKEIFFNGLLPAIPGANFFPRGMVISETFPNLQTIEICEKSTGFFCNRSFLIGCEADVVPTVRLVITNGNPIDLEFFQRWFPIAFITRHRFKHIYNVPDL